MTVSPTLAINEEIARRRAAGLQTIALGFGEASIPVHPALLKAVSDHAGEASYGPVAGTDELRTAAAGYWERRGLPTDADQVVAGPGSKPLLYALLQAIGGPVALPRPSWVSYAAQASLLGVTAPMLATVPGHGGVPDPALLDAEAARAAAVGSPLAAVLVTLPDNPTGTVADPALVRAVTDVAERHELLIISDEIYRDLVHSDDTLVLSPSEIAPERTIVTTGLSKNLALGGWRIGVVRFPRSERADAIKTDVLTAASEIWSAPAHPVQQAAAWAFTEPVELSERIEDSRTLHGRIARAVAEQFTAAGASVPPPAAGFYVYPNFDAYRDRLRERWAVETSDDLARVLLDVLGIATLPGTAFGDDPTTLSLRVATPMLYGTSDPQREAALASGSPATLPWIAESLDVLHDALTSLT